ncbi:MAG: GGDEF domain-containing protein [Bryobacteraceae bacterium]
MISLSKSINEFDRIRNLERIAIDCYCSALQSAEHYLVVVDSTDAESTRDRLREIQGTAERSTDPVSLNESRGQFRGVLRDYQQRAHGQIGRLRSDLESALVAMQSVADSMAARDDDHQGQISRELIRLRAVTAFQDLPKMRDGVAAAVQGIESCVERMQRENQLIVAQLCDEIRVLHARVDAVSKIATLDPATGLLNRQQMELCIESAASPDSTKPVCLVYTAVRNFKLLCHQSGRQTVDVAMAALGARLRNIFGSEFQISRWSDDEVLALVPGDPARAMSLSKQAALQTPGTYPIQVLGQLRTVTLKTQVTFLERRTGESAREILHRVDQFALGSS